MSFSLLCSEVEKLPDQDPDHDEDHPEQQALEGRIQPRPPNRLAFKSNTPAEGSVTRKSSAIASPTTHTIRPSASTTSGRESRTSRGTLRSTRKSWSFFPRPPSPSGRNRSPGRRPRTASGRVSAADATATAPPRPVRADRRVAGRQRLGRDRPPLPVEPDLTWYRQQNLERVHRAPSFPRAGSRPSTMRPPRCNARCPGRLSIEPGRPSRTNSRNRST